MDYIRALRSIKMVSLKKLNIKKEIKKMNKIMIIGRLVADLEVKINNDMTIAKGTIAVPRINNSEADFLRIVAFGKTAETMEKYLQKGNKIAVTGRIQTGSYENKNKEKVYTTDIIVESFDFCESKKEEEKKEKQTYKKNSYYKK